MHASWQPTGAVPSRFRPHFGGLPTSKSILPCRRELDFQKSVFSTLSSKKVSRSVLRASQNAPEGPSERPGASPGSPPEAPKAADRRPGRLHRASGRRGGSILTPYGNPFWGIAGLKGRLNRECLGSPNDYGEGIQDDDGSREKTQRKPRSKPLN